VVSGERGVVSGGRRDAGIWRVVGTGHLQRVEQQLLGDGLLLRAVYARAGVEDGADEEDALVACIQSS
jgi:hypothetical protein